MFYARCHHTPGSLAVTPDVERVIPVHARVASTLLSTYWRATLETAKCSIIRPVLCRASHRGDWRTVRLRLYSTWLRSQKDNGNCWRDGPSLTRIMLYESHATKSTRAQRLLRWATVQSGQKSGGGLLYPFRWGSWVPI